MNINMNILCMVLLCSSVLGCSSETAFFVQEASLYNAPDCMKTAIEIANTVEDSYEDTFCSVIGHRIKGGEGIVIGYRLYDKGSSCSTDNQLFEKVSLYISKHHFNNKGIINGSENNNILFYSRGSSGFYYIGCYTYSKDWIISYEKLQNGAIKARLQFNLDSLVRDSIPVNKKPCMSRIEFNREFIISEKTIDNLSPWDGKESHNMAEEVTPGAFGK